MVKPLFTFPLLLLCWSSLLAQQSVSSAPSDNKHKWSIGLTGSIDYCNRWLYDIEGSDFSQAYIRIFNESEIGKPGYTVGVAFAIPVNKSSVFNTGLLFANRGYQSKWDHNLNWPDSTQQNSISGIKSITTIYHLDIPLVLQTYLNPSDNKWFLRYGLITNIFLRENYTQVVEENGQKQRTSHKETYDFNKLNISPEFGFGRQFILTQNMRLQIAPVFRYGIFTALDAPVATHLWSIGLNMVCYWTGSHTKEI